jgi:putative membrane protein
MKNNFVVYHVQLFDEVNIMKKTNEKLMNIFYTGLFLIGFGFLSTQAMAAGVDTDDFIDEAYAKGVAEIEGGKVAVQKSTFPAVQAYAKKMIEDHSAANKDLRSLAIKKNVKLDDDAELMSKTKNYILKQRDGESFDAAYVNNQIEAHQAAIELYKDASSSQDGDVRQLAATSLPKLERHLADAEALVSVIASSSNNIKVDDGKADYDN